MENLNQCCWRMYFTVAHVAEHFLARSLKNEVRGGGQLGKAGPWRGRGGAMEGEAGGLTRRRAQEMCKILRVFLGNVH